MTWSADFRLVATLALMASAAVVRAAEPPAAIDRAVRERLAADWDIASERIVLEWGAFVDAPAATGKIDVRLVGRGDDGQLLAVVTPEAGGTPNAVRIRAGVADSAMVATRALRTGARLTSEDMREEAIVSWGPPAASPEEPAEPGWEVLRPLAAGDRLRAPAVRPPLLITPGQMVRLAWTRGAVRVELNGTALNGARLGEKIRARLEGRTEPVVGIAVGAGIADLTEETSR